MSYGNTLFQFLQELNFYEFFRGVENVFYFPSSIRYFWPINKLFFGESFYGYILIGFLYIFVIYKLFYILFGKTSAIFLSLIIFFTRIFEGYALSIYKLIKHMGDGDAEPLAIFFFLISILLFLNITKKNNISLIHNNLYSFLFGFFLFISLSLRPNFAPTALLFLIILLFIQLRKKNNYTNLFFSIFGFSFYLLIPFHNYFYGDEFVLFSSGSKHNMHVPPHYYLQAFYDLISFNFDNSESINKIFHHMYRWIKPYEIHYILSLIILFVTLVSKFESRIKIICILALSQHIILLIFEPTGRYSYLAWILNLIIVINYFKNVLATLKIKILRYYDLKF